MTEMKTESVAEATSRQDELYREAASSYGAALEQHKIDALNKLEKES